MRFYAFLHKDVTFASLFSHKLTLIFARPGCETLYYGRKCSGSYRLLVEWFPVQKLIQYCINTFIYYSLPIIQSFVKT